MAFEFGEPPSQGTPWKVLIVEDDEATRELERRALSRAGAVIQTVGLVAEALELLKREAFSVILLDYHLPDGSPWPVLVAAKAHQPPIPVVLVTAQGSEQVAVEALTWGAADYLKKTDAFWDKLPGIVDRVSRLAAAEEANRANELRLKTIIDTEPECVKVVGPEGKLEAMNPAGLAMLEVGSLEEANSFPLLDFILPAYRSSFSALHNRVMEGGSGQLEFQLQGRRGTVRWLETHAAPLRDPAGRVLGQLSITRDITERKQAELALREAHERFSDLVESTDGIVWEADATTFAFTSVSRNAVRMLGYPLSDWLEPGFWANHIHPEDRERAVQYCVACTGRLENHDFEYRFLTQEGRVVWLRDLVKVVAEGGQPRWLRGLMLDITPRKQAEETHRQLQAQLVQAQKMESLGLLAGGVAHDINNVLSAILGLASVHQDMHPPGTPLHGVFDSISKACMRGGTMVKGLLAFAHQGLAEERELDLNQLVREQVKLLERTTLAQVQVVMELEEHLPPIRGDAGALAHALMNLCVNAVDAVPPNGRIALRTRKAGALVELEVEDNGAGMPAEVQARALEPFFTTKPLGQGTGLGLSMVYRTVTAHGGNLSIDSLPGRGTRILLRFPALAEIGDEAPTSLEAPPPAHRALSVLVVDDDEIVLESTCMVLEALGHHPTQAPCGEDALSLVEAGLRPDVVILDQNMPGLGGAATLPRLRALLPDIPVLFTTGNTGQGTLSLVGAHPNVSLMPKPFGLKELQKALAQATGR